MKVIDKCKGMSNFQFFTGRVYSERGMKSIPCRGACAKFHLQGAFKLEEGMQVLDPALPHGHHLSDGLPLRHPGSAFEPGSNLGCGGGFKDKMGPGSKALPG
jgi:hypothetical protein